VRLHTLMHENLRIPPKFFLNVLVPFLLLVNHAFGINFIPILASIVILTEYQSSFWLISRNGINLIPRKMLRRTQRVGYRLSSNADPLHAALIRPRKRLKETRQSVRIELRGPEGSGNRAITCS
jgi:hypothetical protein